MLESNIGIFESLAELPLVLALNSGGEPLRWITYEQSAFYYSKDKVLWSIGKHEVTLRGGTNALSGKQSKLDIHSIIALDNKTSPDNYRKNIPQLSNRTLFARDRNMCAYCDRQFSSKALTRDHVIPTSKGGKDIWTNVVTACSKCNRIKDDYSIKQANMPLMYVAYIPTFNEILILLNKKILSDQKEYLLKGVSRKSRLYKEN